MRMGGTMRPVRCSAVFLSILISLASTHAIAQGYPNRPVKVVVPYTPGGGTDTVARASRSGDGDVESGCRGGKPARGGYVTWTDAVVKSTPDGYTLLFTDSASFVINPHIYASLPFDPLKDLEPISLAVRWRRFWPLPTMLPEKQFRN